MKLPNIIIWSVSLLGICLVYACTGSDHIKPEIVKIGTIDCDLVETTPIVFHNKVYRFEYVRSRYSGNLTGDSYFRFVEHDTAKTSKPFAKGWHLGSAFAYKDKVYVTGVEKWGGTKMQICASSDLENWENWVAFEFPEVEMLNTSLIHDKDKFVLMFEVGGNPDEAGVSYTARFATSEDLRSWKILPRKYNYAMDRYTAPHCLRYLDGYYYVFYLEALSDSYETRVVRSKDLMNWESSPFNPILVASEEDRKIGTHNSAPDCTGERILKAENTNNSDFDFCEYNGKLIINYSWGNQRGKEFLAEAYYNGTIERFLKGWFPD